MTGRELQYRSDCKLYHTGVTDILPVAVEENTIRTDSQAILRKIKPPKAFAALYAGASFTACAVHNGLGYSTYSADRQCARTFTLSVAQKVFADRDLAKTWFFFCPKDYFLVFVLWYIRARTEEVIVSDCFILQKEKKGRKP